MERLAQRPLPATYLACLEDGPHAATLTAIPSLETGQPPELLLSPGRTDGVYVLAGGARVDGSLPYWWMPSQKVRALRRHAERRSTARHARLA